MSDKASGYIVQDGKVTGETLQCAHCQYTSERRPGSGRRRAYCTGCHRFTCGRAECARDQHKKMAEMGLKQSCIPFEEYNYRLAEIAGKFSVRHGKLGRDFTVSETGGLILLT